MSDQKDIARVEKLVAEAFREEDFDFTPLIKKARRVTPYRLSQDVELPTRISIENHSHPIYTLVEVQTPDRLGLLYDLLRALNNGGAHIELSRITTEMGVAMDTFYVTQKDGRKINEESAVQRLQKTLTRAAAGEE